MVFLFFIITILLISNFSEFKINDVISLHNIQADTVDAPL